MKNNNIYQTMWTAWSAEIEQNARLDLCGLFPSWTERSATQHILNLLISYCGAEDYHELVFRETAASSRVLVHEDETKTSLPLIRETKDSKWFQKKVQISIKSWEI